MTDAELRSLVESAVREPQRLSDPACRQAVLATLEGLDQGRLRVAEKRAGAWEVNDWVRDAVVLYFRVSKMRVMANPPFEYHDLVPLKTGFARLGVRVVPPGTVRYGSFIERGAVVMGGYVNIGAYVGANTMVDAWATIGSCAQVGNDVHISGGAGIGGVLEPRGARPVIVEDGAFIGSRSILVEGVHIGARAVLGASVVITASTPIIDVSGEREVVHRGSVPPESVVIPGTRAKTFPAGVYQIPCALVIGKRKPSTDSKTALNEALRDFARADRSTPSEAEE